MLKRNKRIYIAGKMNGLNRKEWMRNFANAELTLVRDLHYHPEAIINPARLACLFPNLPDKVYARVDMDLLDACDAIYLQTNWTNSNGARKEYLFVVANGKDIIFESRVKNDEC